MTEAQLQAAIIDLCAYTGWMHYHTRDSRRSVSGFPDLVLVRERVMYVELKSEDGVLSDAQIMWRDQLRNACQEWHEWRPSDWTLIKRLLTAPRP